MFIIDQYAYQNSLRAVHPREKFLFAILTMLICVLANSIILSVVIWMLMSYLLIFKARIPSGIYRNLLLIPFSFLLIGVVTIAISITSQPNPNFLINLKVGSWVLGIGSDGLLQASKLFAKSFAAVSCLYFLALTTPMVEIVWVLERFRVPTLFVELMSLIYRFIFVTVETAAEIHTAQTARLGYSTLGRGFQSLSQLISVLFIRSYQKAHQLFTSLEARGYEDQLKVIQPKYNFSPKHLFMVLSAEAMLAIFAVYSGGRWL